MRVEIKESKAWVDCGLGVQILIKFRELGGNDYPRIRGWVNSLPDDAETSLQYDGPGWVVIVNKEKWGHLATEAILALS